MDRGVANHVRSFGCRDEETNGGIDTNPHRANGHGMGTGLGIDIGIASYVRAKWARGNPSTQGAEEYRTTCGHSGHRNGVGPKNHCG